MTTFRPTRTMRSVLRPLLVVLALASIPISESNASLLFSNYVGESVFGSFGFSVGTEFTVGPQALSVTALGVYAEGGAIVQATPVGLWRVSDETLVASAIVPTTGAVSNEDWLFKDVTPFILQANTTYRIASPNENGASPYGGTFNVGSGVASVTTGAFAGGRAGSGLVYPSVPDVQAPRLYANAEIAPVPEPSTYALMLAGLGLVTFVASRRRSGQK